LILEKKKREMIERAANSLQQLKAEILPDIKDVYAELTNHNYGNALVLLNRFTAKLSAV
jgi:uncharacterized protein (UPF0335 family)